MCHPFCHLGTARCAVDFEVRLVFIPIENILGQQQKVNLSVPPAPRFHVQEDLAILEFQSRIYSSLAARSTLKRGCHKTSNAYLFSTNTIGSECSEAFQNPPRFS